MAKVKNKRNNGLADKVHNKRKSDANKKKLNPFEVHINREKIKVLGKKSKHDKGLPGVSRAKAVQKRKETLGTEMKLMNKTNTFIDRRIGEKNAQLSAEDRMIARFAAERVKQHSKKNIYNLADDEVLTHRGQTLEQIEKFDDPRSDDEDDDGMGKGFGGLDDEFVSDGHFGGGMLSKTESRDGAKSHKDLIEQLIAESKKRKAEKQKEKEQTLDLTEKLDSEWKDLQPVVFKRQKVEEESLIDKVLSKAEKQSADYDKMTRELRFEKRGTPSDGIKSDEKQAKEERLKLEQYEKELRQRMEGEVKKTSTTTAKHRSAEDLEDNFELEDEKEFMLAYDKEGKPLVPEHILKDYSVPNVKPKFDDGVSDTSDDDDDAESDDQSESETKNETKNDENSSSDDESDDGDDSEHQVKAIGFKKEKSILFSNSKESNDDNDDDVDESDSDSEPEETTKEAEINSKVEKQMKKVVKEPKQVTTKEKNILLTNGTKKGDNSDDDDDESDDSEPETINKKVTKVENLKDIKDNSILITNSKVSDASEDDSNSEDDGEDSGDEKPKVDDFQDLKESDEEIDQETNHEEEQVIIKSFFDQKTMEGANLKELLTDKTPAQQSVVLHKLIKSYNPGLSENNKEHLSRLFAHMLQYTNDIFTNISEEGGILKAFLTFDRLAPYFYDLAKTNKVSTKKYLIELLKEKRDMYKRNSKKIPDLDTLVFFKLVSLLYPTSDYRHPVTTPSLIFMSEILTYSKFNDAYSISRGIFLTSLVLEYTVLSKRLVPSALNFLRGILYLAANTTILNPIQVVPPFRTNRDAKILKLEHDCSKMAVVNKMAAKDLVLDEIDDDFKTRCLLICTRMMKEFFDNFSDLEAQECLFEPHIKILGRVDLENYPKKVNKLVNEIVKDMKDSLEVKTYTPLSREKKRPKALRLYEPDIQEVFTGSKNSKLSREHADRLRLQTKYKKEMKGALREIRRDKSYIASVKIKQKIASDKIRKDKVKQIYKDASIQQGELNKLKRMK